MKHFLYHIIGEVILASLLIFSTICLYNQAQIINKQREFIDELQFNYYKLEEYKEVINLADIIFDNNDIWNNKLKVHLKELFNYICNTLNGSVTGEHGIGFVQREYLPVMIDKTTLSIMKSIKNLLDPNNIINPGKIFLD